jgi:hypothetical protein
MAEKFWYYVKDNTQNGPISESKIKEMFTKGLLSPETLVWSAPMKQWASASTVEIFTNIIASTKPLSAQQSTSQTSPQKEVTPQQEPMSQKEPEPQKEDVQKPKSEVQKTTQPSTVEQTEAEKKAKKKSPIKRFFGKIFGK